MPMHVYLYRYNPVRYLRLGDYVRPYDGAKFQVVFTLTQGVGNLRRAGVHLMTLASVTDSTIGSMADWEALELLGAHGSLRPLSEYASPLHHDLDAVTAVVRHAIEALVPCDVTDEARRGSADSQ